MVTLQKYIKESSAGLSSALGYSGGMNIQLYYCGLIKFCNESDVQTVEQLIINVDIDEITDFPYWSSALDRIVAKEQARSRLAQIKTILLFRLAMNQ